MYINNIDPLTLNIVLKKVKGEKAIESLNFAFTLSLREYNKLIEALFPEGDEVYRIDEIYNNFGIDFLDKNKQMNTETGLALKLENLTKYDVSGFFKIQFVLQDINVFSTAREVQALAESITNNLEELFEIVVAGDFHFYNGSSIKDDDFVGEIAELRRIDCLRDDDTEDYYKEFCEDKNQYNLDVFAEKGYFETTTGVIYIEPYGSLYEKALQKYENKKSERKQ